jgi:hypothetical protein
MKLSSFVMLSSRNAKLSSWEVGLSLLLAVAELALLLAAVELALLLAVVELAAVVVVATQIIVVVVVVTKVIAIVVVVTKVDALAVAANEFVLVAVTSPNKKFQSLPRQTQCPACAIGRDSQRSFQISIHHSL